MKNNTNKFVGSLGTVATIAALAVAMLFLVQATVALAEGAPVASNSANTTSGSTGGSAAPAGSGSSNSGNVAPAASNSSNTSNVGSNIGGVPTSVGSSNVGGSVAPAASNSSNTSATVSAPAASNSNNSATVSAPGNSNSSNSSNNSGASASNPAPSAGGRSGGANGAPGSFSFGPGVSFVPVTMPGSAPVSVPVVVSAPKVNVGGTVAVGGTCAPYLNDFLSPGVNNPSEVTKLQSFLAEQGFSVDVNGVYDEKTTKAVSDFQLKYSDDVLKKSWGASLPSGEVYITTKMKINDLVCNHKSDFSALSYLGKDRKAQIASGSTEESVAGAGSAVASGSDEDSTDEEGGTQEASVAKTSGGFFSKIGNWFSSIFKKNK